VLDDLSKGKRENVAAGAELHVADIRDPDAVFDAVRPDAVLHLAAQVDVRVSVERPELDADVNVLGTVRILEAARRHDAQVVFASSGGAGYGECDGPAREDAPLRPLAPYGTSKVCGEEYLATYNRLYGTGHVSLRLGNVYGPRQEPHGEAGVVAILMGLLRDGGTPRVYGDGRQTRDYVFVRDVARANVLATSVTLPATDGLDAPAFNIATSVQRNVLELADAVGQVMGRKPELEFAPPRPGELFRSALDISKARAVLKWAPEWKFDDGLQLLVEWFEKEGSR